MPPFLDLPARSARPREHGLTVVLDKGLSLAAVDGLLEVCGASVDLVKLGWGTSLVTQNLEPKLARYAAAGVPVMLGGTLTELAVRQGRVDGLVAWLAELGLSHVEVSDGTIALEPERKRALVARLAGEGLRVEQIEGELEAGAWKVVAEGRESGTAGIFRHDGEARMGLIDEIVHAVPIEALVFEAPQKAQQVWFLKRFGTEVSLGNIAPEDVLSLETLRLGLRSDTLVELGVGPDRADDA